ncbi:MAG: pantoate--beta-alanine ligase [Verrucomicrobia bacterium]|nr:MAG: pantoate--beta-alanine ligase [Verrucomicrobiota bacterium]
MRIVTSVAAMQRLARQWQQHGTRIGLVPTMGYLHEGHLSLVRRARRRAGQTGKVVVSIYVNPTQFGPKEDLSRYPRDLKRDLKLCRAEAVDVVFAPSDAEMYPGKAEGRYSTYVVEENLSRSMEGASRPTHFRGVTTVVAKLFNIVQPGIAIFGAKDWQQAAIIKRMVADLNFPVKIIVAPTVRERDGLALSSRNKYLDAEQRKQATILHGSLQYVRKIVTRKPAPASKLKQAVKKFMAAAPLGRLDYVEFFDPETLQPATSVSRGTHMALAVFFANTRLIDNGPL